MFQEFDAPAKLLELPEGCLTTLVNQMGPKVEKKLIQMAQDALKD